MAVFLSVNVGSNPDTVSMLLAAGVLGPAGAIALTAAPRLGGRVTVARADHGPVAAALRRLDVLVAGLDVVHAPQVER